MLNTEIFEECAQINTLIENSNKAEARSMVINWGSSDISSDKMCSHEPQFSIKS